MMRKDVRILLVGEHGVGKTSLILSLVSEEFPEEVPNKAEEITIPADVTPEKVPTHIVDSSAMEQDEDTLISEIRKADVVCCVFAVDDTVSFEKVSDYWIPLVDESLERQVPVILVGNRCDREAVVMMEKDVVPLMNKFSTVETCVMCSAKTLNNISELFYYAQKSVLHPTAPLFNTDTSELTSSCRKALSRIYKICDVDNDNLLNDTELVEFQKRCFSGPLTPDSLGEVKSIIASNCEGGLQRDSLTEKGFMFLHSLFIQRGHQETMWTVLRKFGYDDLLQLSDDYLYPWFIKIQPGCSTELSYLGYEFFTALFKKYDEDQDGALNPAELMNLFSTCPCQPWGPDVNNTVVTNENGWITLQGFLAQWTLTSYLDVSRTMEYLAYLGYIMGECDNQLSAVTVTREKRIDLDKRQTSRNVFRCCVVGPRGVGKTAFLQGLLSRNIKRIRSLVIEHLPQFTINTVLIYGQEKYLLLQEIDIGVSDILTAEDLDCDVVCLIYDQSDPRSFSKCLRTFKEYIADKGLPCLVVASKSDLHEVRQDSELQPAKFCAEYNLPQLQYWSGRDISSDIYVKLTTLAAYPHFRSFSQDTSAFWWKMSIGVSFVAVAGFVMLRFFGTSG